MVRIEYKHFSVSVNLLIGWYVQYVITTNTS